MKSMKKTGFFLTLLLTGLLLSACESEVWNDHYSINNEQVSELTLWETIQQQPSLSKFKAALEKTGYDKVLNASQMYTVWAPEDAALASLDLNDAGLTKEFIENHISRYSYTASPGMQTRVTLLNTKSIVFKAEGSSFTFGTATIKEYNSLAKNGILHVIGSQLPFFSNIWEYLEKDTRLDSLKTYLYSFNKIIFDELRSIPGDVNEEGKTVYLDSVTYNDNLMFRLLGKLNVEDSTYNMLAPTNEAWIKSYDKVKNYYRYYAKTNQEKYTADTLQRRNTIRAMLQDIVFSATGQALPQDSLFSTGRNKFMQPGYLFEGATEVLASNGKIFVVDELKHNHWESWNQEIKVEAEQLNGREFVLSNLYNRSSAGSPIEGVSRERFVELTPTTSAANPNITFEIPNTLSGSPYNVYAVFVPPAAKGGVVANAKPSKVTFQLYFAGETGSTISRTYTNNNQGFVTSTDSISKILVASDFVFPYSSYGLDKTVVKLKINSNVSQNQTTQYTRELLIDCIILEPVR